MRRKLLKFNTVSSLINQIVTIICGFVLPRLILLEYGSEVNGLVNSIAEFLQVIAFLELGVGTVVQSALYKPLTSKDNEMISKLIVSAQKFFTRLAQILLVYVIVLTVIYPFCIDQDFGWSYTALLILSISISSFAQYYFGVVDSLLLRADQRGYIQYCTQIATVIVNTVVCVILIKVGASIHIVKLTASVVYLLRPLLLRLYVTKRYKIDRKISYEGEPIKQKWNGVAQHICAVVLDSTDNIVLTIFSTLSNVSVYSMYHFVVYGVKRVFLSATNGIHALLGELWAKQETEQIHKVFGLYEWILHSATVFIFGCTGTLILPFVKVYTSGISDVNYIQPLFGVLITFANAIHCLRLPYNTMIMVGGHYKQTQHCYIIAAIINIVVSIAIVIPFGLVGVAIGTLVSMLYQTIWMAVYISKNLNKWPIKKFFKQIGIDLLTVSAAGFASSWIKLLGIDYLSWIWMAVQVSLIWGFVALLVNMMFYRKQISELLCRFQKKKS